MKWKLEMEDSVFLLKQLHKESRAKRDFIYVLSRPYISPIVDTQVIWPFALFRSISSLLNSNTGPTSWTLLFLT